MSIPSIPGYTEPPKKNTLASVWAKPDGSFPQELWPLSELLTICPDPTGWLTVEEHFYTDGKHGGRGCVLVKPEEVAVALQGTSWIGHELGKVWLSLPEGFDDGLRTNESGIEVEFFIDVREPVGGSSPVVDISQPFLWYWDAYPTRDGWKYLNMAGREQELISVNIDENGWKVQIRALEFRQYLAECEKSAIVQVDFVTKVEAEPFERVDDKYNGDWVHVDFHVLHDPSMLERPAFSRMVGQYEIKGLRNSRVPRMREDEKDQHYVDFIYGVDTETGELLTHTCDPDQLGTYFDKDNSRLHYLTPVYFRREVLQTYALEPNKYRITSNRLSCLNLWGLDYSINSAGLVEVYLGDLGSRLPSDEWGHWRSFNVTPEGEMEEGRFRRDFLGQFASSHDPVGDLRRARARAAETSARLLGGPAWKPLEGDLKAEFESLIGPLSNDSTALNAPILVLVKALNDAIDSKLIKKYLGEVEKDTKPLQILKLLTERLGDDSDLTEFLRSLQLFRSRGGVAHLASSKRDEAAALLGIEGMSNTAAFDHVVKQATACLVGISNLIASQLDNDLQSGLSEEAEDS